MARDAETCLKGMGPVVKKRKKKEMQTPDLDVKDLEKIAEDRDRRIYILKTERGFFRFFFRDTLEMEI